jgi:hypothetical protein
MTQLARNYSEDDLTELLDRQPTGSLLIVLNEFCPVGLAYKSGANWFNTDRQVAGHVFHGREVASGLQDEPTARFVLLPPSTWHED